MNKKAKIAVIGGTGKAGKQVVQELLRQGFSLRLLLRNPENFLIENPLIELVPGDARTYEDVRKVMQGCDAILSTLGQPAGQSSIFSQATRHVLRAMEELAIRRYVVLTGTPVDTPLDHKGETTQAATDWMKAHYPETTTDKQLEYRLLTESTVDWTLVRMPWLHLTDDPAEVLVSLDDCPGDGVSAGALARFLVAQLADGTYLRQAPFVASP